MRDLRQPIRTNGTDNDRASCAESLRKGSQSFHAASLLLPRRVRRPAQAVYAFCRAADDLVDNNGDPQSGVAVLNRRLDAIYRGMPQEYPEDRAFAGIARRFAIPRAVPQAMLEGFLWDAENRTYETFDDVLAYAARVAGTVGVMMAMLMGVRDRNTFARACELGLAMQLTNIARDVGEDARKGRVYLPTDWLREAGLSPDRLTARPVFSPALAKVVERLLAEADGLYRRANSGLAGLPIDCRIAIGAAARIYRSIGDRVTGNGFDSVSVRAVTSRGEKIAIAGSAVSVLLRWDYVERTPPCEQVRFLVDAATSSRPRASRTMDESIERFFELLLQSAGSVAGAPRAGERSAP